MLKGKTRDWPARRAGADQGAIPRQAGSQGRPITLRIDNRPLLVVNDERARQLPWELVDRIETIEAVREGLEQAREGRATPLEEIDRRLRKKHG